MGIKKTQYLILLSELRKKFVKKVHPIKVLPWKLNIRFAFLLNFLANFQRFGQQQIQCFLKIFWFFYQCFFSDK
jgi:hypothetical protein